MAEKDQPSIEDFFSKRSTQSESSNSNNEYNSSPGASISPNPFIETEAQEVDENDHPVQRSENEKLRPLLKSWRNQLKEAEKQHQERPLIIEWEYVSSKTGKGIRELNEKILNVFQEKTGKYFPHISQRFPNGYWKVEQEVKSLKKRKKEQPFMKWKEFEKEINRVIENSISSKEIEEIVKWMHRCGVLLHFSELTSETTIGTTQLTEEIDSNRNLNPIEIQQEQQHSSNTKEDSNHMKEESNSIEDHFDPESLVILEPQWLSNVFKKVIDHKRRNEIDQDKNGILTDEKLRELWKEYPLEIHPQLKEILEYFELAYSYREVKEEESTLSSGNNTNNNPIPIDNPTIPFFKEYEMGYQ